MGDVVELFPDKVNENIENPICGESICLSSFAKQENIYIVNQEQADDISEECYQMGVDAMRNHYKPLISNVKDYWIERGNFWMKVGIAFGFVLGWMI